MAKMREELSKKFKVILGNNNCYYDPPQNLEMSYPCIIYTQPISSAHYADGKKYIIHRRYSVTIVDENPDSLLPEKLYEAFDYCYHSTSFVSDGMHHFVYDIYW